MKKLVVIVAITVLGLLFVPNRSSAMMHVESSQTEESHDDTHESLEKVLPELLNKYNKDTIQELDCDTLSEEEVERVGDAVMESMHPGEAHERMDEMMGGEGSDSLKQMHIQMGQRYLGCGTENSVGSMGMSGFGNMMGTKPLSNKWSLMRSSQLGGLHDFFAVITWISFIAFLIAGTHWFWKKASK